MKTAYCRWHDKEFVNVAEHEQEECERNGKNCTDCPDLISKECGEEM